MFYHMIMVFDIDVSLRDINKITQMLDGGRFIMQNALTMTIEQTVPFVPTQENLRQYEEALVDGINKSDTTYHAERAHFRHYKLFEPVSEKQTDNPPAVTGPELKTTTDQPADTSQEQSDTNETKGET